MYASLNGSQLRALIKGNTLTLDRKLAAPLLLTLFSQMPESALEDEMSFKCPKDR